MPRKNFKYKMFDENHYIYIQMINFPNDYFDEKSNKFKNIKQMIHKYKKKLIINNLEEIYFLRNVWKRLKNSIK